MADHEGRILLLLSLLWCDVGRGECILACSIQYQDSSAFPWDIVAQSGRLPSEMPVGFRCAGIFTVANDLLIRSLIANCKSDVPGFYSS